MTWFTGVISSWYDNIIAPFRKTSPLISLLHPLAAMVYIGSARVGRIYLVDLQTSDAMSKLIGHDNVKVWAAGMILGGVIALLGVMHATIAPSTPRPGLTLEAWGCLAIFITQVMYLYALYAVDNTAYHTITLTETIASAACARLIIIVFEFRKIRWREQQTVTSLDAED